MQESAGKVLEDSSMELLGITPEIVCAEIPLETSVPIVEFFLKAVFNWDLLY